MEAAMLQLRLPAEVASATLARHALAELTGGSHLDIDDVAVALCVSEAVTNAVVHGYRDRADADAAIELHAWEQDGGLCVVVRDFGQGLAPREDSPGLGLGMPLMSSMADRCAFAADAPGTRVELWFAPVAP
jgi:serine/threonine-protein kinase RsbW/stage II sporulation protein AB (anti-sigma F factor)